MLLFSVRFNLFVLLFLVTSCMQWLFSLAWSESQLKKKDLDNLKTLSSKSEELLDILINRELTLRNNIERVCCKNMCFIWSSSVQSLPPGLHVCSSKKLNNKTLCMGERLE